MAVTSTSHSSNYHVFLSFRGTDTGYGFTGNLYKALDDKGIHTFFDDEELRSGEEITPALENAIQDSRIAIIVLSKHYASSSFCLDELSTIIHCSQSKRGLWVLPVFYKVDPADVRHQRGSYGDALAKHGRRFPENKLQKWKLALRQVADLSGYHFKDGDAYEYKFIGSIVAWVSEKMYHTARLYVGDYLVGLESRVEQVMKLLDLGSDDGVHMVGIIGMAGVGKSTLARVVYNKLIAEKFDCLCYLANVRENSEKHGLEHIQRILLKETLGDEKINVTSVERGAWMIAERLQRKKALLVLDDVDKLQQLKAIVGSPKWFGPGSRVIITTRHRQPLACHKVERIYEMKTLNDNDARQLLTWKAFQKEKADPMYEEVLKRVLTYASGLPLALEVIGSNFFGKSIEDWQSAIIQYKRTPLTRVQHILKGTGETESIYLSVPKSDREQIIQRDGNYFREMKNLKIFRIKNAKFSEGPKCLPNSLPYELDPSSKASLMLKKVLVLSFDYCTSLKKIPDLSSFPNLKKLSFKRCYNLVTVHKSVGLLGKVEVISARGCCNLVSFPPIHLTSLKYLDLSETGLKNFPEISGKMENIRILKLKDTPIEEFPISFVNLVELQILVMHDCRSVIKLPSSILLMPKLISFEAEGWKGMKWLKEEENEKTMDLIVSKVYHLRVSRCNLDNDFFSIGFTRFAHVQYLDLSGNNFTFLPECIKEFQSLSHLYVNNCKHLQEIRGVPPNIKCFKAKSCKSLTSTSISMLINQEPLAAQWFDYCLPGAWIPTWFDHKISGHSISFWFHNKLPNHILCLLIAHLDLYAGTLPPALMVFINGKEVQKSYQSRKIKRTEMDHTYIFELNLEFYPFQSKVALEKEWNHVEVTYADGEIDTSIIKAIGIHVFKPESSEKDIRFTDPCREIKPFIIETSMDKASRIHAVKQESINEDIQFLNPYKIKPFGYDVFLSFRASDTLQGFTGYLHRALHENGIHTYIDDEELQRGDKIIPAEAIEESRIAITVLSINYASSSFCLDELAFILDHFERKRQLVLPVFYNVDPSHVLDQTASYGEALVKHEKVNMEKLQKWKTALHQVANLPGFHFKHGDGYEYELIGRIVELVCSEINHTPLHVGYQIGLESKVLEVKKLLDVGCNDVTMIGIFGTGGVGKSTLSREVYNSIANHFDTLCFIENVREKSKKYGLQHIQSILLSKILGEKDITLTSLQQKISMIKHRLKKKKVLLILDDVDSQEQWKEVVGSTDWFGPGSRVIITTRDKQLLAPPEVKQTYEVKKLHEKDALQLLKWKTFKKQHFDSSYEQLLNRVVAHASGLPLALEIIGSYLFGKSVEEWNSAINQFEKGPDDPIKVIFKASFDALEEKTRSIFLDMACCFRGYELAEIEDILDAHYGHRVKDDIDALVDKSLVKLSHGTNPCYDTITVHDLIEEMGKEIEQQESLTEPSERRRLWSLEDIRKVSGYNMGTSKIEMICLDFSLFDEEKNEKWDGKAFQNTQNLKTIIIRNVKFSKGPEYLPNSLRVLEWWRYPSNCLPSDFHPKELVICKLPDSHILPAELSDLWKKFPSLKVLEFSSANV